MKGFNPEPSEKLSDEEKQTIESLLNYPSLEKVFDKDQPFSLSETKLRMKSSLAELERVVRTGRRDDAEKAAKVAAAFQTALNFLDEIELLRKTQSK